MKTKTIIICFYLYFVGLSFLWIKYLTPADPIHFKFYDGWLDVLTAPWSILYKILNVGDPLLIFSSPIFGIVISVGLSSAISFFGAIINCILFYFIFKYSPRINVSKDNAWTPTLWAFTLGALGLSCGFYGPALLNPSVNQGSLLGLFITGPLSFIIGAVLGLLLGARGINRWQNFYFLGIASFIVAAVTLYMSLPPDRLLGFVIEAEIEGCKDPMNLVPERSEYYRWREGDSNWRQSLPEWNSRIKKIVDHDQGVVLKLFVYNEGKVYEKQKPWNKGQKAVENWHSVNAVKSFFARFGDNTCANYTTERRLFQFSEREASKVSPPDNLPQLLGLWVLEEVPKDDSLPLRASPQEVCAAATVYTEELPKNYLLGSVRDITPRLMNAFEKEYEKKKLSEIVYERLLFSPMGDFLAISISQITSGDPEQVWIVDLKANKVRLVTERVIKQKVGLHIENLCWESEGTLLATVQRIDWLNQGNNRTLSIRGTMKKSEQKVIIHRKERQGVSFMSPSNSHAVRLRQSMDGAEILDLESNKVILSVNEAYWEGIKWAGDKFFVFVTGHGHGSFTLNAGEVKPKTKTFQIDSGSWELLEYAVNPLGPQIAYVKHMDDQNNAIIIYDLVAKSEIKSILIRQWPRSLVWSSTNQLAFTAKSCEVASKKFSSPLNADGDSIRKLCVLQLLDGTKQ